MAEILLVVVPLGLLFAVAYLLDRLRKKRSESDRTWLVPNPILEDVFASVGLRFVDSARIPEELREAGWDSLTYQKRHRNVGRIDPEKFRAGLIQQGWEIQTFQVNPGPEGIGRSIAKLLFPIVYDTASVVDVVHVVLGPNGEGKSVALRSEHVLVRAVDINTESGEIEKRFTDIAYEPEFMSNPDPCTELFDELDKLPRHSASLNSSDAVERSGPVKEDRVQPGTPGPKSTDSISYCTQCGKRVLPGAHFCTGCGAAIADSIA